MKEALIKPTTIKNILIAINLTHSLLKSHKLIFQIKIMSEIGGLHYVF